MVRVFPILSYAPTVFVLSVDGSIKREIGHLCHDERRTTGKDKTSEPPSTASTSVTNPPIDVARAPPGEYPHFHQVLPPSL